MPNFSCLNTVVRNPTAAEQVYGFLGAYGVTLAPGDTYEHPGDLMAQLSRRTTEWMALQNCLDDGVLEILSGPQPLVYDAVLDQTKMIGVENGSVVLETPCYETVASSEAESSSEA